MATNMPAIGGSQHFASVNYSTTFGTLTGPLGRVTFASPPGTTFLFNFETGRVQPNPQVDLWDVQWDYTWFDQDTEEASIRVYLTEICAQLAGLLGLPLAEVEQSVQVLRIWTAAGNVQGSAAFSIYAGSPVTEVLTFLPSPAAADAVHAAELAAIRLVSPVHDADAVAAADGHVVVQRASDAALAAEAQRAAPGGTDAVAAADRELRAWPHDADAVLGTDRVPWPHDADAVAAAEAVGWPQDSDAAIGTEDQSETAGGPGTPYGPPPSQPPTSIYDTDAVASADGGEST